MEKFSGGFPVKTTTEQKNPAKERERAANGFRWQNQKQGKLKNIYTFNFEPCPE